MKHFLRFVLATLAMTSFCCGKSFRSEILKSRAELDLVTCVAVLPFEAMPAVHGEEPGKIMASVFANRLMATKKFRVLEWDEIATILKEQNVTLPTSIDSSMAARIGQILQVEGVIFGTVTEYGYKRGGVSYDAVPVVGVMAKMVSVRNGDTVWSVSYARSSSDFFDTGRDPVTRLVLMAADDLMGSIARKVSKRSLDFNTVCWNPYVSWDIDNDGIMNFADACPAESETFEGILDTDGCPEPEIVAGNYKSLIELVNDKIVYQGTIDYVRREATLLPSSIPILKGIAAVINEHPEIKKVSIEGFSKEHGDAKYLEEFSFNRAMAIKSFLMREGVPNDKLSAIGYEKAESSNRDLVKEIEFRVTR